MRPVIDIRNVHRIFESEAGCAHILHNVSLAVDPGEFVAITGPSARAVDAHEHPGLLGQTDGGRLLPAGPQCRRTRR